MSAYAKEIKKIIVGIKAYDSEKVEQLDKALTFVAQHGTESDLAESLSEVEKFLYEELLNYDVVGKSKTA